MLSKFLRMGTQDLVLDPGSHRARMARAGGPLLDIPSMVAVQTFRSGKRDVIAFGEPARRMLGRTPPQIQVIAPIQDGRIAEYEVAEALLHHLASEAQGRGSFTRPRVVVAIPDHVDEAALRTLSHSLEGLDVRDVVPVRASLAAGLGADLDLQTPHGHLLVDVGASCTQIAVLCMQEIVASTTLSVGGDVMTGAMSRLVKRQHALLVGPSTAEAIKLTLGTAADPDPNRSMEVAGRCLRASIPRSVRVSQAEVCTALQDSISALGQGVRRVLEQTPPEIAADVVDHGIILVGGSATLPNLDLALRAETGLAVLPVDEPSQAIVRGLLRALPDPELLARIRR